MKVHSTNPLTPGKKQNRHLLPLRSIMWEKNAVKKEETPRQLPENFDMNCLAVDAACSGNPGPMEYRGVYLLTGQVNFSFRSCIWNQQYR